jgi:hypothetical protein
LRVSRDHASTIINPIAETTTLSRELNRGPIKGSVLCRKAIPVNKTRLKNDVAVAE